MQTEGETAKSPHILLVNPWIHDFAAYDVWSKPMGLLYLAAVLRDHGVRVTYIDCLDRFHPKAREKKPSARYGKGPFHKTPLPIPDGLESLGRNYSRYGIEPEWFLEELADIDQPDLILVTSVMTYWASGVAETISLIRQRFEMTPVVLGGIYATLFPEHANRHSGADTIITGEAETDILEIVNRFTGSHLVPKYDLTDINTLPYPAYDLQRVINYIPLRTAKGCPYACAYCASGIISPNWQRRTPEGVLKEIFYWHKNHHVIDFAFYDDALLVDAKNHAEIIFQGIIEAGIDIRLHTPNAIHVRGITPDMAKLMFDAGFKTLRLGVETTDFSQRGDMDTKINRNDYEKAVEALKQAGFKPRQIGAYLLTGLPGQSMLDVESSVRRVLKSGIMPVLTHYTPIPGTRMWEEAKQNSRFNLEENPVFTNNSILPCSRDDFSWDELAYLKKLISDEKQPE